MDEAAKSEKQPLDLAELLPEIAEIRDPDIRSKVEEVWQRLWQECAWSDVREVPVSGKIAASQILHARATTRIALAMAAAVEELHGVKVRRDLLVAASLVQDASKLIEYEPDGADGARRTERAEKLGHATYGAALALEVGLPLDVVNVVLSHSPDSTVPRGSLEAKLLVFADQADVAALGGDRFIRKTFQYR